jgi:hypothetical protein
VADPNSDLEMYAEVDPRIALLNGLRDAPRTWVHNLDNVRARRTRDPLSRAFSFAAVLSLFLVTVVVLAIGIGRRLS